MDELLLTAPDAHALLAQRVRSARRRQKLTQARLAKRAQVGVATIHRLERHGSGQVSTLIRVLSALGHLRDLERVLKQPEPQSLAELRSRQ